jgi:serine/threonine protein kinase
MKKGDIINGYTILQDFTTAGGGLCKWTFAKKGTKNYFIKEFLSPTYPVEGSPGSPKTKAEKHRQCELFEAHHDGIGQALVGKCAGGGNLVVTQKFFRWNTKYYKITDKVDVASLNISDTAKLPIEKRVLILKTVAHSLKILHQVEIVHGDLKPDNILIKKTATGDYTTKLIDFDNSYFSSKPPTIIEEMVGDMVYYSPELSLYLKGDKSINSKDLQLKSDIFALGLIYCQYLTGNLPIFDKEKYRYPYLAALHGIPLEINSELPYGLQALLNSMLSVEFNKRPDVNEVFNKLKHTDLLSSTPKSTTSRSASKGLGGSLLKTVTKKPPTPDTDTPLRPSTPDIDTPSSLKGTLIKSLKK